MKILPAFDICKSVTLFAIVTQTRFPSPAITMKKTPENKSSWAKEWVVGAVVVGKTEGNRENLTAATTFCVPYCF
jgi:hypothetical protein